MLKTRLCSHLPFKTKLHCHGDSQTWKIWGRTFSESKGYAVEEVKISIPITEGWIAGKLWKGRSRNQQQVKLSSTPSNVPIVCLHGIQDNCATFDNLLPLILRPDMTMFAFDLPGHGLSSHTKDLYYHAFYDGLISIKRVCNHFGWDKIILLGHSLGAVLSFLFSAACPEQVVAYVAMDSFRPVPREDPTHGLQNAVRKQFEVEERLRTDSSRPMYSYDEIVSRIYEGRNKTLSIEACKTLLTRGARKLIVNGEARYCFSHDVKTGIPVSFRIFCEEQNKRLAEKVKCPVCVIKAEPGEDYEPRENFMKMVEFMKLHNQKTEFHLVPGTHHFHLDAPENIAPVINKFLSSLSFCDT